MSADEAEAAKADEATGGGNFSMDMMMEHFNNLMTNVTHRMESLQEAQISSDRNMSATFASINERMDNFTVQRRPKSMLSDSEDEEVTIPGDKKKKSKG